MENFREKAHNINLRTIAEERSKTLYIRRYYTLDPNTNEKIYGDDGTSEDVKRDCTPEEHEILSKLMYAVFLSLHSYDDADIQTALAVAEYSADLMIPNLNGYLSIYCPLLEIIDEVTKK